MPPPDPPSGDAPGGARRQTVLVVDDEPDLRDAIKQFLEDTVKGIRVVTAPSGRAGLLTLETETIDVIVTDFKMPEMDGLEFLREARIRAPRAARVLVTAFPDTELAIKACNEAGIESFFTKPFIPAKVIAVVQGLLAERRKEAEQSMEFARSLEALRKQASDGRHIG
ncbi:MAG TPA: response regulator [Candidatus Thermoplasmatota archaeon]